MKAAVYTGGVQPKLVAAPVWNVSWIAVPDPYMPRHAIASAAHARKKLNVLNSSIFVSPPKKPCNPSSNQHARL